MKRALFAVIASGFALFATAACTAAAQPGARTPAGPVVSVDVKLEYGGRERRYLVSDYSGGKPAPVVFVLHGGGGHPENAQNMSQFDIIAAREKLIVVYPGGTGGTPGGRLLTWNAGHCCAYALDNKVDDVGFIRTIIDQLVASGRADPKRIYVTGMSNGAMMSHVLARELPDRIAAIAPIVGAVFGDEAPPARPVSALMINGLLDKSVPPQGGLSGGRGASSWDGMPARPNIDQGTYWARYNACDATPQRDERGSVLRWTYRCPAGRAVELIQLKDNGHAWPGGKSGSRLGDTPSTAIDATEVIWAFFKPLAR